MQISSTGPSYFSTTGTTAIPGPSKTFAASSPAGGDVSKDSSVVKDFLKYAKMSPFDRMRAGVLKSMNLSEADVAKMSPDQRTALEQKIRDVIEKQLDKTTQQSGRLVDVSA